VSAAGVRHCELEDTKNCIWKIIPTAITKINKNPPPTLRQTVDLAEMTSRNQPARTLDSMEKTTMIDLSGALIDKTNPRKFHR